MITLDGKDYVVSPQFEACVRRVLGTMTFRTADVEGERQALLLASDNRPLSDAELGRLAYLTHVRNVARAIRVVGAHHDPAAEWGLDGWDAVHANNVTPDRNARTPDGQVCGCGCVALKVFDHHSKNEGNHFGHNRVGKNLREYHIEPRRVCDAHRHLAGDPEAHAEALRS